MVLIFPISSFANEKALVSILKKYQNNQVIMEVDYQSKSSMLQETTNQSGTLIVNKNKFKWTFTNPIGKEILFNGKELVHVEKEKDQVMVTKKKIANPKQLVWLQLFNNPNKIKVKLFDKDSNTYTVSLDKYKLKIKLNKEDINSITYYDELDSSIELVFNKTKFKDSSKVNFNYSPGPSDQVTEF